MFGSKAIETSLIFITDRPFIYITIPYSRLPLETSIWLLGNARGAFELSLFFFLFVLTMP